MGTRVGIIGAGVFGRFHSAKLAARDDVDFIGIYDPDTARADKIAREFNTETHTQTETLLGQSDAMVIACPATFHAEHATEALQHRCHVLIEKPLATTVEDAQVLVTLARRKNLVMQVGHQERFVLREIGLDRVPETPIHIVARRVGKFGPRGTDTSVTFDLMSHDIDMVLWLMRAMPRDIRGETRHVHSDNPDISLAQLTFTHGTARLEASRVGDSLERTMELTYAGGTVRVDFGARTLCHDTPFDLNRNFADDPQAGDSVASGTAEFVRAIRERRDPFITGEDGLKAVQVAVEVDR